METLVKVFEFSKTLEGITKALNLNRTHFFVPFSCLRNDTHTQKCQVTGSTEKSGKRTLSCYKEYDDT